MTSNFNFLATEWPEVVESAAKAESLAYSDPRAACFYTRRALELAIAWLYKHDATKNAMSAFLKGRTPTANQIQFLEEIVNHLTANGVMEAARLYEAPYTYIHDQGVEGVFKGPEIDELISILEEVKNRAIA